MKSADDILNESFLDVRAKLLEVAATLDRIDRAADAGESLSNSCEQERQKLSDATRICLSEGPDRAERLQQLFSRPYETNWREKMQL